ncbi:MAG: HAMP domain-containing protein [Planctomycetes bacterium]|nr:HAMP domain-containing protein [Planctomycetota bacterium]
MQFKFGIKIAIVFGIFFLQLFCFTVKFFNAADEYEHYVHELQEEIEELDLVRNFQMAISGLLMPANDFLILGGDSREPENFAVLAKHTEGIIGKLENQHYDYAEEQKLATVLKKDYFKIKDLSHKIFAIPDAKNSEQAGRLMEQMDKIGERAIAKAEKLHQAVIFEIDTYKKRLLVVRTALNKLILFAILFNSAFMAGCIIYFRHAVYAPILSLYEAASELGQGNFDTRVEFSSNDEIGKLCHAFNGMAEDLQEAKKILDESNKEIEQLADHVQQRVSQDAPAGAENA